MYITLHFHLEHTQKQTKKKRRGLKPSKFSPMQAPRIASFQSTNEKLRIYEIRSKSNR